MHKCIKGAYGWNNCSCDYLNRHCFETRRVGTASPQFRKHMLHSLQISLFGTINYCSKHELVESTLEEGAQDQLHVGGARKQRISRQGPCLLELATNVTKSDTVHRGLSFARTLPKSALEWWQASVQAQHSRLDSRVTAKTPSVLCAACDELLFIAARWSGHYPRLRCGSRCFR